MSNLNTCNTIETINRLEVWAYDLGFSRNWAKEIVATVSKLKISEAHARSIISSIACLGLSEVRIRDFLKEISSSN